MQLVDAGRNAARYGSERSTYRCHSPVELFVLTSVCVAQASEVLKGQVFRSASSTKPMLTELTRGCTRGELLAWGGLLSVWMLSVVSRNAQCFFTARIAAFIGPGWRLNPFHCTLSSVCVCVSQCFVDHVTLVDIPASLIVQSECEEALPKAITFDQHETPSSHVYTMLTCDTILP